MPFFSRDIIYLTKNTNAIIFKGLGFITTDLLREILKELDEKITPTDLDQMIEEIDADGSGTVDWDGMTDYYFYRLRYYCLF